MSNKHSRITFRSVICDAVKSEQKGLGVNAELLLLAKECETLEVFESKCKVEERWIQSAASGQMHMEKIPRCWVEAKSHIRGCWKDMGTAAIHNSQSIYQLRNDRTSEKKRISANTNRPESNHQEDTLAVAIANGEVLDAKSNVILPEELREFVSILNQLTELSRDSLIRSSTANARKMLKNEKGNQLRGINKRTHYRGTKPSSHEFKAMKA